jgi:hypothetical protein
MAGDWKRPWSSIRQTKLPLRHFAAVVLFALAAQLAPGTAARAAESKPNPGLAPYKARYQVTYRSISGGQLESAIRRGTAPGQWTYESRAYPNLLGRVAVSPDARQRSTMEVLPGGVRPLWIIFDDGTDASAKDMRMQFDWTAGRVSGESKGKPFDLPLEPGTQDSTSVQVAMLIELTAGREPKLFRIQNGARLEEYRYWSEGRATVVTPLGQYDTVVWASQRQGSKRVNRVWHAPSLGYVPVQAIQYNKGRPDVQMKIVAVERGSVPAGD